jgi:hypothetical protein
MALEAVMIYDHRADGLNNEVARPDSSDTVSSCIRELVDQQFWGSLEIKFESGCAVLIKKIETMKPDQYRRENRGNCNARTR